MIIIKTTLKQLTGETASAISAKARELGAYVFSGSFVEKQVINITTQASFSTGKGKTLVSNRKIPFLPINVGARDPDTGRQADGRRHRVWKDWSCYLL
jgi:hypothetical protein